jgi:hypothetical protein
MMELAGQTRFVYWYELVANDGLGISK